MFTNNTVGVLALDYAARSINWLAEGIALGHTRPAEAFTQHLGGLSPTISVSFASPAGKFESQRANAAYIVLIDMLMQECLNSYDPNKETMPLKDNKMLSGHARVLREDKRGNIFPVYVFSVLPQDNEELYGFSKYLQEIYTVFVEEWESTSSINCPTFAKSYTTYVDDQANNSAKSVSEVEDSFAQGMKQVLAELSA